MSGTLYRKVVLEFLYKKKGSASMVIAFERELQRISIDAVLNQGRHLYL